MISMVLFNDNDRGVAHLFVVVLYEKVREKSLWKSSQIRRIVCRNEENLRVLMEMLQ